MINQLLHDVRTKTAPTTDAIQDDAGQRSQVSRWALDPLSCDGPGDEIVVTTSRRLVRLAVAATDVGARFAHQGLPHDPAAWMLAPRAMFHGRSPIEACQELEGFHRNVLLQGLRLDLDANPEDLDSLLQDEPDFDKRVPDAGAAGHVHDRSLHRSPRRQLLTCWVEADGPAGRLFAFCALVTDRPADLVERVVGRFGREAARNARFGVGFDRATTLATAMISDAMADTLALAASDPESSLAAGLDVIVQQRFQA